MKALRPDPGIRLKLIGTAAAVCAAALVMAGCESAPAEARSAAAATAAASAATAGASAAATPANGAGTAAPAQSNADDHIIWNPVGQWSGHGSLQTESFPGDTGSFRIRWKADNDRANGKGHFALTIHSAISGRPLEVAVEDGPAGEGTAYVQEDPRIFFAVVDAADLDWSFTIEEALTR
jgi:hypothetical protein